MKSEVTEVELTAWELNVLCEALEQYNTHGTHKADLLYKLGEAAARQMEERRRRNRRPPTSLVCA